MDRYEIQVATHLDQRRVHALGCEEFRLLPGGISVLVFRAADQAAIYGLLTRLRDAGLELVAAERVLAAGESMRRGADPAEPSKEDSDVADR
jgi:hypothetical protein